MKAAFIQNGSVQVGALADPVPGKGLALVRAHSCGMCASEQHSSMPGSKPHKRP